MILTARSLRILRDAARPGLIFALPGIKVYRGLNVPEY